MNINKEWEQFFTDRQLEILVHYQTLISANKTQLMDNELRFRELEKQLEQIPKFRAGKDGQKKAGKVPRYISFREQKIRQGFALAGAGIASILLSKLDISGLLQRFL